MKVAKTKKPFRKNKMKSTDGVVSDNEAITHKRFSKKDVSLKKASKSDSKLFRNLNARIREKQFGMSNSMNDLSNIKTSKKTDDSVEDLKGNDTEDFDNYDRPRERQRSSSLDMGRGLCGLFFFFLVSHGGETRKLGVNSCSYIWRTECKII